MKKLVVVYLRVPSTRIIHKFQGMTKVQAWGEKKKEKIWLLLKPGKGLGLRFSFKPTLLFQGLTVLISPVIYCDNH